MQHRDNLAELLDRHPEPHELRPAPQPCADFIQLHMGQVEVLETRWWSVMLWAPARVREVVMVA
jgi:hypothetical protein